jgi:hypothetical protein
MTSPAVDSRRAVIAENVARLRLAREELARVDDQIKAFEKAFYSAAPVAAAVAAAVEDAKDLASHIETLEATIKTDAVALYGECADTKPAPGVLVKILTELRYNRDAADRWTKEKALFRIPECLDEKAFEKFAKASPELVPFVSLVSVPKATITKELVP